MINYVSDNATDNLGHMHHFCNWYDDKKQNKRYDMTNNFTLSFLGNECEEIKDTLKAVNDSLQCVSRNSHRDPLECSHINTDACPVQQHIYANNLR